MNKYREALEAIQKLIAKRYLKSQLEEILTEVLKRPEYRVHAKEWFDKTHGNSYNSVRIFADDVLVACLSMAYGYGSSYLDRAKEHLGLKDERYYDVFKHYHIDTSCLQRDVKAWGTMP